MGHSTKESGIHRQNKDMVEATKSGVTEVFMKDIGNMIRLMVVVG